ncbi:MAG: radical SAM protein [Thermodesulfobacteriota bacterium]
MDTKPWTARELPVNLAELPRLMFADQEGTIYEHPSLLALGASGNHLVLPEPMDWIPLPEMSKMFLIPECPPIGLDPDTGTLVVLRSQRVGRKTVRCCAVAAFMEPGYVRTLLPAADYSQKDYVLPLWAYTAAGLSEQGTVSAAFRVEHNPHWDPRNFDDRELLPKLRKRLERDPAGPMIRHLARCATSNHCFAAKNLFLGRWEAPLPVSRRCNARCLGCLSHQPKGSCTAAHRRLRFRPSIAEIVDLAVEHLETADEPIVSFGQGCEGEPLTEASLIAQAVREIRLRTSRGTINLNTNGSLPRALAPIVEAGLDSIRVSLNSARPAFHRAYFRPKGFDIRDVKESLTFCSRAGLFTMINYLVFPGVSDQEEEWSHLKELIEDTAVRFLHLKNLCIDPQMYLHAMPLSPSRTMGMKELWKRMRQEFPNVELGYFNRPARRSSNPTAP